MSIRSSSVVERLRGSLFFVPMLSVLAGGAAGVAMIDVDAALDDQATALPLVLTSTVDGAREVLGVVAGATITVAGIAFSISLLVIQQASGQYSPRVVHSLFRDPFNRRVMGLAVGTFTYCLMVLRAVRGSLADGGDPVVPNLSVGLAVVLGVASILAIIAFIDHNAHTMEVSQVLQRVTDETLAQIDGAWPNSRDDEPAGTSAVVPAAPGHPVPLTSSGWIQQLSLRDLLDLVPDGGTVRVDTAPGRFAVRGTPLCTVWPAPDDPEATRDQAARAIEVGRARTMQQDPSYGVRQLADVALRALSPGVNDPTTAQDAIFHLAEVLAVALARDLPAGIEDDERGRRLVLAQSPTPSTLVELAFDEVRQAAAAHPTVCIYLLEALHLIERSLIAAGLPGQVAPLRRQAELTVAGASRSDLLDEDLREVRTAFTRRFGDPVARPRADDAGGG
jgi:uncharacterized membrane protein